MTTTPDDTVVVVIPARMASTRLPGKPLYRIAGKELLLWTHMAARRALPDSRVVVAACDPEVSEFCMRHEIEWVRTADRLPNGTARAAAACMLLRVPYRSLVINWQVDEPAISPAAVGALLHAARKMGGGDVATLVSRERRDWGGRYTIAFAHEGVAWWFSRAGLGRAHFGIYAYYAGALTKRLGRYQPTPDAREIGLEQITWIQRGHVIRAAEVGELPASVDTPSEAGEVAAWLAPSR